jgi:hypothetical protein
MRFASKYGRFAVQVQNEVSEHYATGQQRIIQPLVVARFAPGGLEPFERELVLGHWSFNGSYQEMDEVTTVPPDYRIGVFDSRIAQLDHGWSDETREQVEQSLQQLARYDDIIELPRTMLSAPWPKYDEFRGTVAQLLKKLDDDGHDLQLVLEYERAVQNRPALISALQSKLDGFEQEPEPVEEEIRA